MPRAWLLTFLPPPPTLHTVLRPQKTKHACPFPSSAGSARGQSQGWAAAHRSGSTGDKRKFTLTFPSKEQQGATHRGHRQVAVPAEKGVRDGHTDALSGTAVLGGEGHFSLLDTVGDRGEGRSSIGGLLDRRDEREDREGGRKAENSQAGSHEGSTGCYLILLGHAGEGWLLGSAEDSKMPARVYLDERAPSFTSM